MLHSKKRKSTVYSPIAFIVVMLTLFSLTVVYDSNHIISTLSHLLHRRHMEPPTTPPPSPAPMRPSLPVPRRDKITVAICALSKSKPTWEYVHDSSVYKLFLTGIYQTTHMQSEYDIGVHVGVDTDDVFWSKKENYNALVLASTRDFNLKLTVHHYAKKQSNHLPMNELMRDAARTGAEYLVRLNDDTQIKSMSWLPLAVHQLSVYDPPNVGVVGPVCREGKTSILTHDMVHRTHLEIFDTYYPPKFHNWYVDDWISAVYGPERTTKIPDWVVHHYVSPPRYNPIMVSNETLQASIRGGRERIQAYLSRRNVSRKLSQVNLRNKVDVQYTDQFKASLECDGVSIVHTTREIYNKNCAKSIRGNSAAIFIFADSKSEEKYTRNINSFRCYVSRHKDYQLVLMSGENKEYLKKCSTSNIMFMRHCMLANYMAQHPHIPLFLAVDADNAVIDMSRRLETFAVHDKDITFQIRFHNGEISANYLVRNTAYSRNFLHDLSNMKWDMNSDNGALHQLILKRTGEADNCLTQNSYLRFLKCFHETVGESDCQHDFWKHHASVLHSLESFQYDGWLTKYQYSPKTFIHHAMKNPPIGGNNNGRIFPDVLENGCKMPDNDPYRISPEQEDHLLRKRIDSIQSIWNANGLYNTSCILFKALPTSPATASRSTRVWGGR